MDHISRQDNQGFAPYWIASCPASISSIFLTYLSREEALQICRQFQKSWRNNNQVLWTGMLREDAQKWADKHDMATLTTAMGPLMQPNSSTCRRSHKSRAAWSTYIKGASAIFAWYISGHDQVTVLSPPLLSDSIHLDSQIFRR